MADWTEPSQDILMKCPYCPSTVSKRRFLLHLTACAKKYFDGSNQHSSGRITVVICPFNKEHHVLADDFEKHMIACNDAKSAIDTSGGRVQLLSKLQSMSLEDSYRMNPSGWQRRLVEADGSCHYANLAELIRKLQDDPDTAIPAATLQALSRQDRAILSREHMRILEWSGKATESGDATVLARKAVK